MNFNRSNITLLFDMDIKGPGLSDILKYIENNCPNVIMVEGGCDFHPILTENDKEFLRDCGRYNDDCK